MPTHLKKLRNYLIALWVIPLLSQPLARANGLYEISSPDITWSFKPTGSENEIKISPSYHLRRQIPKTAECCNGTYIIAFEKGFGRKNRQEAIESSNYWLLPPMQNIREILINGKTVHPYGSKFSSAGPIVSVPAHALDDPNFRITINVQQTPWITLGPWIEKIYRGGIEEVFSKRESNLIFQKYLPLFTSIFLLIIAIVIGAVKIAHRNKDKIFDLYILCLASWSAFYFFLSGIPRSIAPEVGSYLHLLIRSVAGLTLVHLMYFFLGTRPNAARNFSRASWLLIFLAGALSAGGSVYPQVFLYFIINVLFAVLTLAFFHKVLKSRKSAVLAWLLSITSILFSFGAISDSIKILSYYFFGFHYELPFLNRYTSPPLLLTSLFYFVSEASQRYLAETKANATLELSEQILHDLRTPVGAIKNVIYQHSVNGKTPDGEEILAAAFSRINDMTDSLRIGALSPPRRCSMAEISRAIEAAVHEFNSQRTSSAILFPTDETDQIFCIANLSALQRIIINLLNNARDASTEVSTIEVLIKNEKKCVKIIVKDTGRGIPPEHLRHIFQRYKSFGKTEGWGLGLYNARQTLNSWHGEITARSNPYETVISLTLPHA